MAMIRDSDGNFVTLHNRKSPFNNFTPPRMGRRGVKSFPGA